MGQSNGGTVHNAWRALLAVAVGVCIFAPAASATTLTNGTTGAQITTGPYARWLADSKIPGPTGTVIVYPDANTTQACGGIPGATACSAPGQIWVGGFQWHAQFERELGHQWDFQHMAASVAALGATQQPIPLQPWQQEFETLWHLNTNWWGFLPGTGGGSAGEWFADSYQLCAMVGPRLPSPTTMWEDDFEFPGYGWPLQMAATCALIRGVDADPAAWETAA